MSAFYLYETFVVPCTTTVNNRWKSKFPIEGLLLWCDGSSLLHRDVTENLQATCSRITTGREMTARNEKSPNNVANTSNAVHCFRTTSGSKWGRQTCFLPRAPSNLVTLLSRTHFIFAHSVIFRGAWERLRTYSNDLWKLRMIDVNQTKFGVILVERKERFGFFCKSRNCIGYSILKSTWHSHKPLTSCNFHWRYGFHHFSHKFLFILNKVLRNIIVEVGHS